MNPAGATDFIRCLAYSYAGGLHIFRAEHSLPVEKEMISSVTPTEETNLESACTCLPPQRRHCGGRWRQGKKILLEKGKDCPLRLFMKLCGQCWGKAGVKELD